jgi:hypothetical protein
MTSPARFLLFVALVIVGVKASEQGYAYVAYRDERAAVKGLHGELGTTGAELLEASARLDSLHGEITGRDAKLTRELEGLHRIQRQARHRQLPADLYAKYMTLLQRYNLNVESRNEVHREWESLAGRRDAMAVRYNLLADSIHALAVRMGQPYYQVPGPLEAAANRNAP